MGHLGDIDYEQVVDIPPEEAVVWQAKLLERRTAFPDESLVDCYNAVIPRIRMWSLDERKAWFTAHGMDWHVPWIDDWRSKMLAAGL